MSVSLPAWQPSRRSLRRLSYPLTVADAVETGDIIPLFQAISAVIYQALLMLLDYL
ncbi:MAG TPA: hypothetical protein VJM31_10640 [Vicinamibacterales bacterium]|nr:hypothetical protein [Vicinamibacterales bacterium]